MEILPGFSKNVRGYMNSLEVTIFALEHYLLIVIYSLLFVLVNYNFYTILIRQRKYKTWPLLAFYVFAYMAITFRLIDLIWLFISVSCPDKLYMYTKVVKIPHKLN